MSFESSNFNTPVALIIFNRPDLTKIVFETIRQAAPKKLLVIADGPRNKLEREKCNQAREVIKTIDWDCELLTNYSDVNLGCKKRVASGITWVFEQVENAIILEDDCLPHPSFFLYCQTMLNRYRNEEQIMHIAGVNFLNGTLAGDGSYYFSKYPHIWGWATWKRAWEHYSVDMPGWASFVESQQFKDWCLNEGERIFWKENFKLIHSGKLDTWDYQWLYSISKRNGFCLMPNCNMISNLGFRSDATHTNHHIPLFSAQRTFEYHLPDQVSTLICDDAADKYTYENILNPPKDLIADNSPGNVQLTSLFGRVKNKLSRLFN